MHNSGNQGTCDESISIIAADDGYNQSKRRFLSILAKTLPASAMGFGWTGTNVSLTNWTKSLYSSIFKERLTGKRKFYHDASRPSVPGKLAGFQFDTSQINHYSIFALQTGAAAAIKFMKQETSASARVGSFQIFHDIRKVLLLALRE